MEAVEGFESEEMPWRCSNCEHPSGTSMFFELSSRGLLWVLSTVSEEGRRRDSGGSVPTLVSGMESVTIPVVASVVGLLGPACLSEVGSSSVTTQPCWQGMVSGSLGPDCRQGISLLGCPELPGVTNG